MEIFERISGARMHVNFYRPNILRRVFDKSTIIDISDFVSNAPNTLNEIHTTLSSNKV